MLNGSLQACSPTDGSEVVVLFFGLLDLLTSHIWIAVFFLFVECVKEFAFSTAKDPKCIEFMILVLV